MDYRPTLHAQPHPLNAIKRGVIQFLNDNEHEFGENVQKLRT